MVGRSGYQREQREVPKEQERLLWHRKGEQEMGLERTHDLDE